ncbi:PDDEXK family nuclease [Arthrobacter koreensis]|uniref:hypothetical protein n=1 Tax=Arthrobacter koreensis TaxID=199136 RepID=UPI002DBCD760|nr:hypothetical protein [Arthrobacter koreensis]MEB7448178.1 hypothetical protein [Arthrobacter koreensis]
MGQILIRQVDGSWREPAAAGYALEAELQEILAAYPKLIPGVRGGAAACREFQSGVGPADVVVVDSSGELTLVECKLAANPQVRREIVGQMFDYAARLWKLDIDDFEAKWRTATGDDLFAAGDEEARDALARSLQDGRFHIVLAVDAINGRLKRMIEYLNAMTRPETTIIAVEYVRLVQGEIEILVPQTYGQELAEAKTADAMDRRTVWDLETYRIWLEANEPETVPNFSVFADELEAMDLEFVGSRSGLPTGGAAVRDSADNQLGTVSLFHYSVLGTAIEFNFIRMSQMPDAGAQPPASRSRFLDELEAVPGFENLGRNLRATSFTSRKPNVSLAALDADALRRGLRAVDILRH